MVRSGINDKISLDRWLFGAGPTANEDRHVMRWDRPRRQTATRIEGQNAWVGARGKEAWMGPGDCDPSSAVACTMRIASVISDCRCAGWD